MRRVMLRAMGQGCFNNFPDELQKGAVADMNFSREPPLKWLVDTKSQPTCPQKGPQLQFAPC